MKNHIFLSNCCHFHICLAPQEYGVVPVLYASTWLLTAFACPFPPAFSGRVIDVMLTEGRTHVLLRAALAVMLSCAEDLLALDDFEALITHLKVCLADALGKSLVSDVTGDSTG